MRVVSVCSFTLSLDPADRGVTVCSFTGLEIAECGVFVCELTCPELLEGGVNECSFLEFMCS